MFRRKLFKHAFSKRALPIILSVAMTFQSMPATALAAEDQAVEETVLNENAETGSTAEDSVNASESDTVGTGVESSDTADEDAPGGSDGQEASEEESGQNGEEPSAEDASSISTETEDAGTDAAEKIAVEDETLSQEQETSAAKIVVDDKKVDDYAKKDNGFTRILSQQDLRFFTEYVEESKCSQFQQAIGEWISIEVDGEKIDALKDRLTYNWVRKAEGGEETDTPLINAFPKDAGEYELTISMDLTGVNGLCEKLENDLKIYLTIEKADIELSFEKTVDPGRTVGEFIDAVNKDYEITYKNILDNKNKYNVSRDILAIKDAEGKDDPDKKLPLHVFVIDENGMRQPMDNAAKFDRNKDYVLTIDDIALTEHAAKNYELCVEDSYRIEVGQLQETAVRFELKDPGKDLIEVYAPDKAWTIDEVTKDLFTEAVADAAGTVTKVSGTPTVFVTGKDGEEDTILEGAVPEANWYTRIRMNSGSSYKVDEAAGEIEIKEENITFIYKPMTSDPVDAGEYFILWTYGGDDSAYKESCSKAVRFTIDPAPVVIQISPDSAADADFRDGMDADAVRKALAKVSYSVYPLVENAETGVMEAGAASIETDPGFFGTSYKGDVEEQTTQYYVPEFVLESRPVRITQKGEAAVDVDPRAVVWREVTGPIKVVVDEEKDLEAIADQLPKGLSVDHLESVEYEFRIRFTGNKVIYDNDGKIAGDSIPVTDVTTNAANRNYLADISDKMLEDTALPLSIEGMRTESVQIITDAVVDAFIADNKDVLDPQPDSGVTGEAARAVHQGTLENPAVKIYDQNALFADRASYKKAAVHKFSADGGIGEALPVLSTDESLQYTWSYTTLEKYDAYLEKYDEVQRQYKDFEDFNNNNFDELGWTDAADGSLDSFKNAGMYRLTVTYNDPDYIYKSAKAEVFFRVNRQEIIIVPKEQYVKNGDSIASLTGRIGKVNQEDYTIYKLPRNSIDEYNALTDEEKKSYALPTDAEIADYEDANGTKPDLTLDGLTWTVLRKEKDPASGLDKTPEEWIKVESGTFDEDFTYGVAAHWTGSLNWLDGNDYGSGGNYTTRDVKTYMATGEDRHHESAGAVRFYDRRIYVEVDAEMIKALGHEYNGEPIDLKEAAKALSFYTDEALTEDSRLPADTIVNTADEYDPAKINIYWEKNGYTYANKNAVYGGTYTLKLRFEGGELGTAAGNAASATYAPLDGDGWKTCADIAFTVSPREITIVPKAMAADLIIAGEKADTILKEGIDAQGIVENDQAFFEYAEIASGGFDVCYDGKNEDGTDKEKPAYIYRIDKTGGYPAFNTAAAYIIQVDGREIKDPGKEYLRFDSTYTIKLTNDLQTPLKESYKVTYKTVEIKVEKRGSADITPISSTNTLSAKGIDYEFNDGTYTIRPRGAVKFYYNTDTGISAVGRDGTETLKNTNILGFRIYAPKEFMNDFNAAKEKFVYQNAVWNAGGYFLNTSEWVNNGYITVVFPLTKEDTEKSFNITWEDGYTETFTLADIVLEDDFTKAVAPKSLAFNGVSGKMAVGETQQLDLKITKAQLGDVINIRYRIKGGGTKNEYISLDPEKGVVTALMAGKAATVVEAYPVYKDEKGDFVPVKDSKGKEAKAASTKITVTQVTASSVKKITPQDESAKLYFTVADDGYRREIYVVDVTKGTTYADRKKWKPADFDKAIDGMNNGEWENAGFAVKPIYSYAKNNDLDAKEAAKKYDKKLKAHIQIIPDLEFGHEYVVYVRNVSAARELQDGSVVALSAGGAVKNFKTTKPQVQDLELGFTVKTGESDKKNTVTHPVRQDGSVDTGAYTVELSAKKAQLNVYGYFSDKAGGNDAAEDKDQRRYSLVPTLKEEKGALKNYLLPKLVYTVYDSPEEEPFKPGLEQSKYAVVSNKGMITLKGVDLNGEKDIYIYVRDSIQHEDDFVSDAEIKLTITAKPATVTGKKVKMNVGQTVKLSDCLEYKDVKKKKIPNYRSCGIMITKEMIADAEAAGYKIVDAGGSRLEHDWRITAVSPNKASFELNVTDFDADGNPMEAAVKLTSAQIDAVKGLKVTYTDDTNITINFTHPANSNEADDGSVYDYALEVKDARGNVVDKIVISNPHKVYDIDGVNAKELKNALTWIQYTGTWIDDSIPQNKRIIASGSRGFNYYTGTKAKTGTFAYTYYNEKLVRLSSYTISVTPLYENQKSEKTATVKAKTTNIAVSLYNVDLTSTVPDRIGGSTITVHAYMENGNENNAKITKPNLFISGNTYTLRLYTFRLLDTKYRASDTIIWKSSNTKVASVKAVRGTDTATFKALNQGTTTITLMSKVTKKVIARYQVKVHAVKNGSSYGGDYEPTWTNGFYEKILALYDPFYEGRLEVLSENVPLVIDNSDAGSGVETWVSFTAPHYGQYTFSGFTSADFYDSRNGEKIGSGRQLFLEENQTVYFRITGNATLKVTGTELARLTKEHTKESPLEVKKGYVSFTAWEDNVYTFYLNGTVHSVNSEEGTAMQAGETKYIWNNYDGRMYVTCREEVAAEELKTGSHPTGTVELDKDKQVQYISFTANASGDYTFTYQSIDGVEVNFSTAVGGSPLEVDNGSANAAEGIVRRFRLEEGEKIVIELKAVPEITDAEKKFLVSVTVSEESRRRIEDSTITIPKGTTEIVEYVIPAFATDKARFRFKMSGETGTAIEKYYDEDYNEISAALLKDNALTVSTVSDIKAGDRIYVKITAGEGGEDAKDAVLTVTQVPVAALDGTSSIEIDNDTEQWYTFTAAKDGYYEFGAAVAESDGEDKTPTHSAAIDIYKELFGSVSVAENVTSRILRMRTGEMIAVQLTHSKVDDIIKDDGTTQAVKSNVTVSVNPLEIDPLAVGVEKAVQIPAKSKEVRYYSFTASAEDDYTISWQAADAKADNAKVTYFSSITTQSGSQTVAANGSSIRLKSGEVRYIKVETDDLNSVNPVRGALLITAANLNADALTAGTAYPFQLADQDKKIVKFTAAESGLYAIVTTVNENAVNGLPYEYPAITYEGRGLAVPQASVSLMKGETIYFTLSFDAGGSEVRETAGTITIRSLAESFEGDQIDVSVPDGITKEYTYTIPESGRYEFTADYDSEKAKVEWYAADDAKKKQLEDGSYYPKNTKIKAVITGCGEDADASVKLYKPALISTIPLNAGRNGIEVPKGEAGYYELKVSQPVVCGFDISDIADGKAGVSMTCVINNANDWKGLPDGGTVSMAKNDRLIIKITSGSVKKDASCVLNIIANTELKLGDNAVHLEAGESVNLIYRAYETGYYSFNVNQPGAQLVLKAGGSTRIGDRFYDIEKLTAKKTCSYTVTNEDSSAVDFTVVLKYVEPIVLEPDKEEPAAKDVSIAADEWACFALKTFKKGDYIIKITDTSKGEDLYVELGGSNVTADLKKTIDSAYIEKNLKGETLLRIRNDGIGEMKATVELITSKAQPLTGKPVEIGRNESRLISFVAPEDDRYLITKDNKDVTMTLVDSLSDYTGRIYKLDQDGMYQEAILNKGGKLVYRLSYEPEEADKSAESTQTVTVNIAPVQPADIEAESTTITLAENDNRSVWYQFTADEDAVYTFALEDEYENEESDCIKFYEYITNRADMPVIEKNTQYMKAGGKILLKVDYPDEGTYTLKYTAVKTITETGVEVLDFNYRDEVQKVPFVVPRGGIYKVSVTAIKGNFSVFGRIGQKNVLKKQEIDTFFNDISSETVLLRQGDIVTFTVQANSAGKSSVSLRIDEVSVAASLELGKEVSGLSDTKKDSYYEIRIKEKGLYAVTAGGEPEVAYSYVSGTSESGEIMLEKGTDYIELGEGDRIIVKVAKAEKQKAYTLKVEKVDAASLDGKNTKDEPFAAGEVENAYYGFTTQEAYVRYTVPEDGEYYIAVQTVNDAVTYNGMTVETPAAKAVVHDAEVLSFTKGQTVTFMFTNSMPKDEEKPEKDYKEALFRLTIRKAAAAENNTIGENDTKQDILGKNEAVSYQFKAAEAGRYEVRFSGSNCTLSGAQDGDTIKLAKDETLTLTVSNASEKAGSYKLTVIKVIPAALTLGTTTQGRLDKGEKVYYEFTSTEKDETLYQVYVNSGNGYDICKVDADGVETKPAHTNTYGNWQYVLMENERVSITIKNSYDVNVGYKVTVKKVEYAPIKLDEPASGTLESYEKAYYTFTSEDESENGTEYQILVDGSNAEIEYIQAACLKEDGSLGDWYLRDSPVTLKKGEKLLIDVRNKGLPDSYSLTIEKTEKPDISYDPIASGETKTGKLAVDGKAGYEFTADDAAEDGTLYSVYYSGTAKCSYIRTTTVTETDDAGASTTKTVDEPSQSLSVGSNEATWKKGDKIRFTLSGAGKYSLTVKKVAYTPLTSGTTVTKTLNAGEAVYYEFTSQDEPAKGEIAAKYQVYGTTSYTVKKVTVNEDNTISISDMSRAREYDLKKGESLRFKVINNENDAGTFKLTINKVVYSPMTLGTPAEGRLNDGAYAYYQFTSQDEPAEGETTTKYRIYGTADYRAVRVTVNEDQTTQADSLGTNVRECDLAKGQILQFIVTGPADSADGYNLTVVKYEEKPVTIGSRNETGSLGKGQQLVYTFKYEGEAPSAYTVSYKEAEDVAVTVSRNGSALGIEDRQRIIMSKDDILMISIEASDEVDNFEFTVNDFKPEALTLDAMTGLRTLSANETVYYQYKAAESGSYVISMVESSDGLPLSYGVTRADAELKAGTINSGIGELTGLEKDDVVLLKVSAPAARAAAVYSFRLMIQKAASAESMTALPWSGSLQPGEVKYFKFTIPEADKENAPEYIVTITGSSDRLSCWYDGNEIAVSATEPYSGETTEDFTLEVANTSMYSAADCKIEVQMKEEPLNMGSYTGKLEPNEYRYFTFPGNTIQVTDAETGAAGEDFAPYFYKTLNENQCTIERKNDKNQWVSVTTGMNSNSSDYVVRVRNKDSQKTCDYAFELRGEWRDKITDVFQKEYSLEYKETAYFTVTAPADKTLYVSVSSEEALGVYYGTNKNSVSSSLGREILYGVAAGQTCHFKVVNDYYSSPGFTLNVTEPSMISLQQNIISTVYIPSEETVLYEFKVPENGSYKVIVGEAIASADHQYKVGDGTEDETFESGQVFELTANAVLSLSIENRSLYNRSCEVQILKVTAAEMGEPTQLHFKTHGDVYCLAVPVAEAGRYIINGQVLTTGRADFYVDCLNDAWGRVNIDHYKSSCNKNLPEVQMGADETIYIKVWTYGMGNKNNSPTDQYLEDITITVTPAPADS